MLNRRIRYAKALDRNRDLFDPSLSVLEVGHDDFGIAPLLRRKITSLSPFPAEPTEWTAPVTGGLHELPFANGTFDIVVCLDGLERLSGESLAAAIAQLVRVARKKVILSCPCGTLALDGERQLAELFQRASTNLPSALTAHLEKGLPSTGDLLRILAATEIPFEIIGNESMNQHYAGLLLEHYFPLSHSLDAMQSAKSPFAPPVGDGDWDIYYSFLFTLHLDREQDGRALDSAGAKDVPGRRDSRDVRFYSVYHKPWPMEHLGRIQPIYAGAMADAAPAGAITDIPADGARLPNTRWSELSAYYKIWKDGPRSDIVGFCHYRRLFNFAGTPFTERVSTLKADELEKHTPSYFDEAVLSHIQDDTILCTMPFHVPGLTIWNHYQGDHNINDYCDVLTNISHRYPQLMPFVAEQFHSESLYATNLIATNWPLFDEICRIWFDLLIEFAEKTPGDRGIPVQNRDASFLAERIFDLWIRYKKSRGAKVIEYPHFFIQ